MNKSKAKPILKQRYLSKIDLENFKAFGENFSSIEFAPKINLIFGKNSTGKSSIIQALRLFRQSYGKGRLTPFNLLIPEKFKNRGGINIDIGYQGIINNKSLKKKLRLGASVEDIMSDKNKKNYSLFFEYRNVQNFYKGKKDINIKNDQTILNSMGFSRINPKVKMEAEISFPSYEIFDQKGKVSKNLESQRGGDFDDYGSLTSSAYESIHKPYYYKVELSKFSSSRLNLMWELFNENRIETIKLIEEFIVFFDNTNKTTQKIESRTLQDIIKRIKITDDFNNKFRTIWKNKKLNKNDRAMSLEKIKNDFFRNIFTGIERDISRQKKEAKNLTLNILEDLKNLKEFLKFKAKNKEMFFSFIKNSIKEKFKKLIMFKGDFNLNPDTSVYIGANAEGMINYPHYYLSRILNFITNKACYFEVTDGFDHRAISENTHQVLLEIFDKITIVPVLRRIPKEYEILGIQTDYVGAQGHNLAELLVIPKVKQQTNFWLKKLEMPYTVDVRKSGDYYRIVWKPINKKIEIDSHHIGLGFPMLLPLVVQAIVSRNKIIIAEEPEIHLHPKLECDLADLLVWSSKTHGNQFIIETHSEDLLLRILKKIRNNEIENEDVSANYVKNENGYAQVKQVKLNKYGQYETPWKDNLFADRIKELR